MIARQAPEESGAFLVLIGDVNRINGVEKVSDRCCKIEWVPYGNRGGLRVLLPGVKVQAQELSGKEVTGHEMYGAAKKYCADIASYLSWPFSAWFAFVRLIPYESDENRFPDRVIELVPRPAYLLDRTLFPQIDCKKKSILIGAWAHGNGYPFRFLAVSSRLDGAIHHVFPQINFGNGWVTVDATFPEFEIGQGYPITHAAELAQ